MIAAQLWQLHRLEGRTQRRGSWSVSLLLHPDIATYSVFSVIGAYQIYYINAAFELPSVATTELYQA